MTQASLLGDGQCVWKPEPPSVWGGRVQVAETTRLGLVFGPRRLSAVKMIIPHRV